MITSDLRPDCGQCAALCCVALPFAASSDFALDKPAGRPCLNLREDFGCGIHDRLRPSGFAGCTVFDCLGAGQHVTQHTFGGRTWREGPPVAEPMFAVFPLVRQLFELRWYLQEALTFRTVAPVRAGLTDALARTRALADAPAEELRALDVDAHRAAVVPLLRRASTREREASAGGRRSGRRGAPARLADHAGADLIGADLGGRTLRGASFRGAYLIRASLRGADLRAADFTGADLRDADLRGADLSGALFLVPPQLAAARGDLGTALPSHLDRPGHWL
ncbi:pentapeptide repeat-containing protein [Cryptosporangium sp. NPDC051539]|uniref:pentapeptide repeat-containing protein n=1 Tax=Cryptosporangium sp. NPDC051539 TaxID=3363962 RepID=UPI0037986656